MADYLIKTEISSVMNAGLGIQEDVFQRIAEVIRVFASQMTEEWRAGVHAQRQQRKLSQWEYDRYVESIRWRQVADFEAIVEATFEHAKAIEEGRPARDLKKMLSTSLKVRTSKKGNRYLHIPFWHKVSAIQKQLQHEPDILRSIEHMTKTRQRSFASLPTGVKGGAVLRGGKIMIPSPTGRPGLVMGRKHETGVSQYAWGDRITGLPQKHRNLEGLIRSDTSSGKQNRSERLTIRTMSDQSSGWIVPPQEGLWIAKKLVERMGPKLDRAIGMAVDATP